MTCKSPRDFVAIDWEKVKADFETAEVREDHDGFPYKEVYVGTVFQLRPSGKLYMHARSSNVEPCPYCKGKGNYLVKRLGRRVEKKLRNKTDRKFIKQLKRKNWYRRNYYFCAAYYKGLWCPQCNGCGSREAYLDELWYLKVDKESRAQDCFLAEGEGSASDIMARRYIRKETNGENKTT